jgi:hypothetical protein
LAENERQRTPNEGQKRKAPTRKNPHERLTVKGLTLEAKIKYHILTCKTRVSTKQVQIKQNPPLCLQRTPRGTQGFGKAGDFFVKSRAEPPAGNDALYKGRSLSNHKSYGV